jgi:hypothetical protein
MLDDFSRRLKDRIIVLDMLRLVAIHVCVMECSVQESNAVSLSKDALQC